LKQDHDRVEELFARVKANDDEGDKQTFNQIRNELELHTHIEEQIFYPHLLSAGDEELKKLTREAVEEHRQVKMFLEELETLSDDRPSFDAKLKVLIEDVEHHVEEEEGEMFPMVEDQIDEETLVRLGTLMEGEKKRFAIGQTARTATAR
jgi:iron-sulfur cluster repair protein YtfE (RIC family)